MILDMKKIWDILLGYVDIFVLFVCVGLVFGIWYWGVKHDETSAHRLSENAQEVHENFDANMEHMLDYIGAVKGLFEGSEEVTQAELSTFVKAMMGGGENYDSLLRFAVFKRVDNKDIEEFKKDFIKKYDRPDYELSIDENFDHQFVSINVVDGKGNSVAPSGQNLRMFEDREDFLKKVDAGSKNFVDLLQNVRNISEYNGRVVVVGLPIIKNNKIFGFVVANLSVDSLIKDVGSWQDENIAWKWTWNDQEVATGGSEIVSNRVVSESVDLEVDAGENLKFHFVTERVVSDYWSWVLGLGVLMSFVVYAMVYALSLSGAKTKEMAETMTKDLVKFKLALDSNNSHVIITDSDGVIVYANDSVTRLTGYSREEIIGKTPRLWGQQMPADFYAKFWDIIKNKRQVFRGEVTNKRKDGELYIAEAIVSPIISQEGDLLGFVGAELDVTDRKKGEEAKQKHTDELEKINDLMVDREMKMIEMKKELEQLRDKKMKT